MSKRLGGQCCFGVDEEVFKRFHQKAAEDEMTEADILRTLMKDYVDGKTTALPVGGVEDARTRKS